jgi:hypothetical protein
MDDTPPSPRYGKRAFKVAVFYYQLITSHVTYLRFHRFNRLGEIFGLG